jgi:hypothetical protein
MAYLKYICAWCGVELASVSDHPSPGEAVSHGICLACANSQITGMPRKLEQFLDDIALPVFLVDSVGLIRSANRHGRVLLGKELSHVEGLSGGVVFECAYAWLPEGCGNTVHCSGCTIRKSVMSTHATGRGLSRIPATLRQQTADEPQEIRLLISTEKFHNWVMLRIDAVLGNSPATGN